MKTKAFYLFSLALISLTLFSCSDEDDYGNYIFDFAPYNIIVAVQDTAGNDLLASEQFNDTRFEYSGTIYNIVDSLNDMNLQTRTFMEHYFYGLRKLMGQDGYYILSFGEFSGEENVTDEQIIIHWGDGTTDNLSFSNYTKVKNKKAIVDRTIKVNGKLVEDAYNGRDLHIVILK